MSQSLDVSPEALGVPNKVSQKYKDEQISKDEYDNWRYNYANPLVEESTARLRLIAEVKK